MTGGPFVAEYRAFISYAQPYHSWVQAFHHDLEASLQHAGAVPHEVYLDSVDLATGESWVAQLERAVATSEHFILVVTPEALVSPNVEEEWEAFRTTRRDFADGHFHPLMLVEAPLPPFRNRLQYADWAEHDEAKYREQLQRLVARLLKLPGRQRPELPAGLNVPAAPSNQLPREARAELVKWLSELFQRRQEWKNLPAALGLSRDLLQRFPNESCAASALLVYATKPEDRRESTKALITALLDYCDHDEKQVGPLHAIQKTLVASHVAPGAVSLLATYLEAVRAEHDRLMPFLEETAKFDLLHPVFVPLELRRDERRLSPGREKDEHFGKQLDLGQVLSLSPEEHDWVTGRWVILGDPGSGKTTLLRHFAATSARNEARPWVPVFASLPRLLEKRGSLLDRLLAILDEKGFSAEAMRRFFESEATTGRLVFLLDGLDEVGKERQRDAETLLHSFAGELASARIVVTSRPIGYRRPAAAFRELDLLALEPKGKRTFLARWFGRHTGIEDVARANACLAVIEADRGLAELASIPLYLTLMALLFEGGQEPEPRASALYDQIFRLLLDGGHRLESEPMPAQESVREVLQWLGFQWTEENLVSERETQLEKRLLQGEGKARAAPLREEPRWKGSHRNFLTDLARSTNILGPHDGEGRDWRFWHRTFREALAAEELAERWRKAEKKKPGSGQAAILAHVQEISGDESRWAEPYALLAGQVSDPDALVRTLVEKNPALGLRALATAQGLREETILEILELATNDIEERGKVLLSLPEKLGDADRTLKLINRLRGGTTNGNDLFFLELATRDAAKLEGGQHARAAEALLAQFYDRPGKRPPEELFHWIDTPRDGRVELWKPIPAGSFLMGSPDGVGDDDEHPQHEVRLKNGFWVAAVPVTNAQYAAFDRSKAPYRMEGVPEAEFPHHPRVAVTWYEAMSFCRWLGASFPWARGARLPTEEEWEYACRAGTPTAYWSGDDEAALDRAGWYSPKSGNRTHRVGKKEPNSWGLYDVHGNALEWTASPWTSDYSAKRDGIEIDPQLPHCPPTPATRGGNRVLRGGSAWKDANWARAAYRRNWNPWNDWGNQGFRVVLPGPPS